MRRYYYGMRLRGFSPNCQPMRGLIGTIKDEEESIYHDILIYDRKLNEEEMDRYELDFIKGGLI